LTVATFSSNVTTTLVKQTWDLVTSALCIPVCTAVTKNYFYNVSILILRLIEALLDF